MKSKLSSLINSTYVRSSKVLAVYKFWCHLHNHGDWYFSLAYILSSRTSLFIHAFLQ